MRIGDRVKLRDALQPVECSEANWQQRSVGTVISTSGEGERQLIDIEFSDLGQISRRMCAIWYDVEPAAITAPDDVGL